MTAREKAFGMLGLSTRAGKSVSGEFAVETALKRGQAKLVILSEEASNNTVKHFTDMAVYRHVPVVHLGSKEELGKYCGKSYRSAAAVTDKGFAERIAQLLES